MNEKSFSFQIFMLFTKWVNDFSCNFFKFNFTPVQYPSLSCHYYFIVAENFIYFTGNMLPGKFKLILCIHFLCVSPPSGIAKHRDATQVFICSTHRKHTNKQINTTIQFLYECHSILSRYTKTPLVKTDGIIIIKIDLNIIIYYCLPPFFN